MKTAKQVSELLAKNIEAVVMHLLPNGKRSGSEWRAGSKDGDAGQSLGVHLTGAKAGVWCDFATGESGDTLDLWALVRGFALKEALRDAGQWLGLNPPSLTPNSPGAYKKPAAQNIELNAEESPVRAYLTNERGLTEQTLNEFRIGEVTRAIVFPYYRNDELLLVKKLGLERIEGKKRISVEKDCEPILFGWQALDANARTIAITEGEIDAMSLHQYGIPALSIPFGVNNDKWIMQEYDNISMYDEIYLCMDSDEPGKKASLEFAERLGKHRCRIVNLPYKDANECLVAGVTIEEIKKCFVNATYLDPAEIKGFETFTQAVIEKFYPTKEERGYRSFIEKSQGKILFRPGELSIWAGINGHGKSIYTSQLMLDFMMQGAKICIASLEMRPEMTLMRMTKQAAGLAMPSPEYIRAIHDWYAGKGWLFALVGTAKREKLLDDFLYMKHRYGVDVFVIDSLLKCGLAEDDYNGQKLFVERLCDFKNEHNVHVHLIAHPRKADDEMTPPNKMNIKGSGAITDLADNVFTVWRNKRKERAIDKIKYEGNIVPQDMEDEYDALWLCEKQRNGDWEKTISLWFDPQSMQFLNSKNQKPKQYVNYSNITIRG